MSATISLHRGLALWILFCCLGGLVNAKKHLDSTRSEPHLSAPSSSMTYVSQRSSLTASHQAEVVAMALSSSFLLTETKTRASLSSTLETAASSSPLSSSSSSSSPLSSTPLVPILSPASSPALSSSIVAALASSSSSSQVKSSLASSSSSTSAYSSRLQAEIDMEELSNHTDTIQEARLANKRPPPPSLFEAGQRKEQIAKDGTLIQDSDPIQKNESNTLATPGNTAESRKNDEYQNQQGLGKVGTALLSIGGVLMVAGITASIFVWRSHHQHPKVHQEEEEPGSSSSPTLSQKSQRPSGSLAHTAINFYNNPSGQSTRLGQDPMLPTEDIPLGDYVPNRQDRLDFNYSMEKLFNNTRQPLKTDYRTLRILQSTPFAANNVSTDTPAKMEVDTSQRNMSFVTTTEEEDGSDLNLYQHIASPISIQFPATPNPLSQDCRIKVNLVRKDT